MFPITQGPEIWNITSLDMYLDTHKVSLNFKKFFFVSKKNTCFLSIKNFFFDMDHTYLLNIITRLSCSGIECYNKTSQGH